MHKAYAYLGKSESFAFLYGHLNFLYYKFLSRYISLVNENGDQ